MLQLLHSFRHKPEIYICDCSRTPFARVGRALSFGRVYKHVMNPQSALKAPSFGVNVVINTARAIKASEVEMIITGGVDYMIRAQFALPKARNRFRSREPY